jgi:hypothetical protein
MARPGSVGTEGQLKTCSVLPQVGLGETLSWGCSLFLSLHPGADLSQDSAPWITQPQPCGLHGCHALCFWPTAASTAGQWGGEVSF